MPLVFSGKNTKPVYHSRCMSRFYATCLLTALVQLVFLAYWFRDAFPFGATPQAELRQGNQKISVRVMESTNLVITHSRETKSTTVPSKRLLTLSKSSHTEGQAKEVEKSTTIPSSRLLKAFENRRTGHEEKQLSQNLTAKLKGALGRQLTIDFIESKTAKNIENEVVFRYDKPRFPKRIPLSETGKNYLEKEKPTRYVRIYDRSWEQMAMNMRALLGLSWLAKMGARRVVQPMVKNSVFAVGPKGHSLDIYFNLTYMERLLLASGYATFVDKTIYEKDCSSNESSHAIIHFLYDAENAAKYTEQKFKLSSEQYKTIKQKAKAKGWTSCPFISKYVKESPTAKMYCIDPAGITEWSRLEKEVTGEAKCLTIVQWRGLGGAGGYRTYFNDHDAKFYARDLQLALKPSNGVLNEVKRFKKDFLAGGYIAVQVRGEKVVISSRPHHKLQTLRSCLNLAANVVRELKKSSQIAKVFIATDMSNFGSSTSSWEHELKGVSHDENTLKDLHNVLIQSTGAVVYKPTNDDVDQGVVALVEMSLISHANHLITIGYGSFQEWVVAKFLEQHREITKPLWSLIKLCSK